MSSGRSLYFTLLRRPPANDLPLMDSDRVGQVTRVAGAIVDPGELLGRGAAAFVMLASLERR
jgi:hypothetical protein